MLPDRAEGRRATLVAVVVAWRSESTVGRTLASLVAAGVDDIVVVVSDSAKTSARVRSFCAARKGEGIGLVESKERLSAGAARNLGQAEAPPSEFILFVDADVRVLPSAVSALVATAQTRELAACSAVIRNERRTIVSLVRHWLEFKEASSPRNPPKTWRLPSTCLLVRTTAFEAAGGFVDLWPGEDLVFAQALSDLGLPSALEPKAISYHLHPEGLTPMLRHQWRLGATSATARLTIVMPGTWWAQHGYVSALLLPARSLRLLGWAVRSGVSTFIGVLLLAPLWFLALAAWTLGFVSVARLAQDRRLGCLKSAVTAR